MRQVFSTVTAGMSSAATNGWAALARRGPVLWLTLCGVLLVAGIFAVTAMAVGEFRERTLANRERELENTVQLIARHFDQQFQDSDVVAADLIGQMNLPEITSPAMFRERMSGLATNQMLRSKISSVSYLGDIAIYDADGELINWSRAEPLPKINVSSRAYFQTFKSDPMAESVILESVRSFIIGKWTTIVARRLSGADGSTFLGAMVRRIDPDSYRQYFASVALAEGTAISLFDREGKMLARYPHVEELIGRNFKDAPLMRKMLAEGGRHTLRVKGPIDGEDRLGSGASLSHFPLVIVATNTTSAALADWRQQTGFMVTTATLSAIVIALILFLIIRQISRQNREAQERIEAERLRLDTALNNMSQGLILYDAAGFIVTCNRRYSEMFGLSDDIIKPGCHIREAMQHRKERGTFGGDVETFCTDVMRVVAEGKVSSRIHELPNGRAFQVINTPLAQGGWVATIEEITERRNLEQERDRNYMFLREIIDHIPSQITVKDALTRQYLLVNRTAEEQFGQSGDVIVGKTPFDMYPEAAARIVNDDDSKALQAPGGLFKDEHTWQSQTKGPRYITSTRIGIRDKSGEPRYLISVVEDVTERRRAHEKIAHMAHYDALTDLPNRTLFREQIERELAKVAGGEQFALLYIDVDEFKGINDSLGHHVGDELLKAIATRLRGCLKKSDLIARLGGDEFAVIQTGIQSSADVLSFVTRIYEAIRQPYHCLGHQLSTDASIGIALAPQDGTDLDQLIKHADLAMYGAKAEGRRTHRFFEPEMDASAKARLTMEQDLRQALVNGRLRDPLPAAGRPEHQRRVGLRGAAALAASRTRLGVAGGVHSDCRGYRPDQRARRLGAAHGLQRGRDLAGACADCGQRLAGAAQMRHAGAADCRRTRRLRALSLPARARNHRGRADPRRRGRALDPAPAPVHRRAHRARRFRHRLFLAELSEALPVRQDQDRPLLRRRHRGDQRRASDRAGGGEHRRGEPHDHRRRGRRDRGAARDAARARLHGDAGLSVQQTEAGRRGAKAVRSERCRAGGGGGLRWRSRGKRQRKASTSRIPMPCG
ncbi:diguanylate cyclase (GGDEF)-like protein/PAS domain S-box-containing protein [Bradyrhizobium sp. i1.3.6]